MPDVDPMPTPYAIEINLSTRQQQILEQITQQTTNTYRLVRRAQLILRAAQGEKNTKLSAQLKLSRNHLPGMARPLAAGSSDADGRRGKPEQRF